MKPEKAIAILWRKLDKSVIDLQREFVCFKVAVRNRNPDGAGEYAPEILRMMLEVYTRLGSIGALEMVK